MRTLAAFAPFAAPLLILMACASEAAQAPAGPGGATPPDGTDASSSSSSGSQGASSSSSSSSSGSSGVGSSSSSGGSSNGGSDAGGTSNDAASDASLPSGPTPWENPCTGPVIDTPNVLSRFAPAATTTTFGKVWVDARKRQCQDQTGCLGWQPATSVDLYRIAWNGNGFDFIAPTKLNVPAGGSITCEVPGPYCTLSIAPMTSNVYPPEQGRPLGITPRVDDAQVQVGSWSPNPSGTYLQYTSSVVTTTCLWGSMSGRAYGTSGTYVETELVVWGSY